MCGRITQHRQQKAYAQALDIPLRQTESAATRQASYNVPPGSAPLCIHAFEDETPTFDTLHWGYRPNWAAEKGIAMAINARIEKAATGRYFRHMWQRGRLLVPADGWYEWTGETGHKTPWYIRLKSDTPMFLAAITNFRPDRENPDGTGLVIVTAPADAGMVDVHDRRPLVLAPQDARLWMDPELPAEAAEQIARATALPAEDFTWYRVGRDVNRVGSSRPQMIAPVDEE
jgi:putative SOS response-associated peptidase YedK